jgi:hypothetical protein
MKFAFNPDRTVLDPVADLVVSAPAEFETDEAEMIIEKARKRFINIEANGGKICRHQDGALRGFVLTTLAISPYDIGHYISIVSNNEGYLVNADYYGQKNNPNIIDHGFTEADLGSVYFVVEATDVSRMPGHDPNIPGSLCANMPWGEERNAKFETFCTTFSHAGECRAVNYLSHGLILLHDLNRHLLNSTLGSNNYIDYIQQEYDHAHGPYPYFSIDYGQPWWDTWQTPNESPNSAAVLIIR